MRSLPVPENPVTFAGSAKLHEAPSVRPLARIQTHRVSGLFILPVTEFPQRQKTQRKYKDLPGTQGDSGSWKSSQPATWGSLKSPPFPVLLPRPACRSQNQSCHPVRLSQKSPRQSRASTVDAVSTSPGAVSGGRRAFGGRRKSRCPGTGLPWTAAHCTETRAKHLRLLSPGSRYQVSGAVGNAGFYAKPPGFEMLVTHFIIF